MHSIELSFFSGKVLLYSFIYFQDGKKKMFNVKSFFHMEKKASSRDVREMKISAVIKQNTDFV